MITNKEHDLVFACATGNIDALEYLLPIAWTPFLQKEDERVGLLGQFLQASKSRVEHHWSSQQSRNTRLAVAKRLVECGARAWPCALDDKWSNAPLLCMWRAPTGNGMGHLDAIPREENNEAILLIDALMRQAPTASELAGLALLHQVMYTQSGHVMRTLAEYGIFDQFLINTTQNQRLHLLKKQEINLFDYQALQLGLAHANIFGNIPNCNVLRCRLAHLGLLDASLLEKADICVLDVGFDDGRWTRYLLEQNRPWATKAPYRPTMGYHWSIEQMRVWMECAPDIFGQPLCYRSTFLYQSQHTPRSDIQTTLGDYFLSSGNLFVASFEDEEACDHELLLEAKNIVQLAQATILREKMLTVVHQKDHVVTKKM